MFVAYIECSATGVQFMVSGGRPEEMIEKLYQELDAEDVDYSQLGKLFIADMVSDRHCPEIEDVVWDYIESCKSKED